MSTSTSSLRPRVPDMKFHGNPVAVLDMKSDQVRPLDKSDEGMYSTLFDRSCEVLTNATGKEYVAVDIPRLKSNVPVYIPRTKDTKGELIAEVNLWSMGVRYNLRRLLGNGTQLYVMNG